jgi:hypothetical protein
MDDFWPDADHELKPAGESPRFLEQDVDGHFGAGVGTDGREQSA